MTASALDSYRISKKPYYLSRGSEVAVFEAAYAARLPVMLKGPTGCGKTRFVEHMAFRLQRPLITVACHEDLFASDLIGRHDIAFEHEGGYDKRNQKIDRRSNPEALYDIACCDLSAYPEHGSGHIANRGPCAAGIGGNYDNAGKEDTLFMVFKQPFH